MRLLSSCSAHAPQGRRVVVARACAAVGDEADAGAQKPVSELVVLPAVSCEVLVETADEREVLTTERQVPGAEVAI